MNLTKTVKADFDSLRRELSNGGLRIVVALSVFSRINFSCVSTGGPIQLYPLTGASSPNKPLATRQLCIETLDSKSFSSVVIKLNPFVSREVQPHTTLLSMLLFLGVMILVVFIDLNMLISTYLSKSCLQFTTVRLVK